MTKGVLKVIAVIALAIGLATGATARARLLTQYVHSNWTTLQDAPSDALALAQTANGFLWIGTRHGLYRFDGLTFERADFGNSTGLMRVSALVATNNGDLWIGYGRKGLVHVHDGMATAIAAPDQADILQLADDRHGGVWVAFINAPFLANYNNGHWTKRASALGLPGLRPIEAIATRPDGGLFIELLPTLFYVPPGGHRAVSLGMPLSEEAGFGVDRQGHMWVADQRGVRRVEPSLQDQPLPAAAAVEPPGSSPKTFHILFDRDGNLWGSDGTAGIFKIDAAAPSLKLGLVRPTEIAVDTFSAKRDGLSSDVVRALIQGLEGNIWVETLTGLDKFRLGNVVTEPGIPANSALGYLEFADRSGAVFIGDSDTLYRVADDGAPRPIKTGLHNIEAMCQGSTGSAWLGTSGALFRVDGDRLSPVPLPPSSATINFYECAVDTNGHFWAATSSGLFRFDGRWQLVDTRERQNTNKIIADPRGGIYASYRDGIGHFSDKGEDGFFPFPFGRPFVRALFSHGPVLFAGSDLGLIRFDGRRFKLIDYAAVAWAREIEGFLETKNGDTWLYGNDGLFRLKTSDFLAAFDRPRAGIPTEQFDRVDGIRGNPQNGGGRELVQGGDGRIWLLTGEAVHWLDPHRLIRNTVKPPVLILRLVSQTIVYSDPLAIRLKPGASDIEIDYTANSLTVPERVRFKYRLEGVDRDWVVAGGRRQAFYTNLHPGHYVFRVIAANNDGLWNEDGASVAFDIPPTFTQSVWFYLLIAVIVVALLWTAYSLRLRQVASQLRGRMEERVHERERIARELHDTLLQSVQGLVLQFSGVLGRLPVASAEREALGQTLDLADDVLVDSRRRVRDLRAADDGATLAERLGLLATSIFAKRDVATHLSIDGRPRAIDAAVTEEIERLSEEALKNVAQHADARTVEVALHFESHRLSLIIRDDGNGIAPEILASGAKEGRFGLVGMRERAARVHGDLVISADPAGGTRVTLRVPGRYAYGRGRWWWSRRA